MAILTGADGQLKHAGKVIGKTRNWSLSISRDAIETTALGDWDRNYTTGIRGTTGSASLFYDPSDKDSVAFLNTIFANNNDETVEFVFEKTDGDALGATGFLTSVGPSVSVGEAQACQVQFQFSGAVNGTF